MARKRLYLDNNVYDLIEKQAKAVAVQAALSAADCDLIASETNLIEYWSADDAARRSSLVGSLRAIATKLFDFPFPYVQAGEFLEEVRRVQPAWLSGGSNVVALANHRFGTYDWWDGVLADPAMRPDGWQEHRAFMERVIANSRGTQKGFRQRLGPTKPGRIQLATDDAEILAIVAALADEDWYWRYTTARHWDDALRGGNAGLEGLKRFAEPCLKPGVTALRDYMLFWLRDVDAQTVRHLSIVGLTEFFQLESGISHGNAQDLNHADSSPT